MASSIDALRQGTGTQIEAEPVRRVATTPFTGTTPIPLPKPPAPPNYTPIPVAVTGGNAPVSTAPATTVRVTGGTAPVQTAPTPPINTVYDNGQGTVAQPSSPPPTVAITGGNAPVSTLPPLDTASLITGTLAPAPMPTIEQPQQVYQENMGAGNVVQDYLNGLLGSGSNYIQNARLRGVETAQNRGLRNSSIAAGAGERAAIESAQPILNQMMGLHNQREQLAFTGEQNQLDRNQQITMTQVNDWANNNQFIREYNGQLSLIPITSVASLNNALTQAAIDNPEIFPPEIVSGLGEFFSTNLLSMLQSYFPNSYGGGGG